MSSTTYAGARSAMGLKYHCVINDFVLDKEVLKKRRMLVRDVIMIFVSFSHMVSIQWISSNYIQSSLLSFSTYSLIPAFRFAQMVTANNCSLFGPDISVPMLKFRNAEQLKQQ